MLTSTSTFWPTVSAIVAGGIGVLLDIALVVLALTVVRKRSPTGATLMAAAAGLMLLITIAAPFAHAGATRLGGVETYLMSSAILGITFALVRAAAWAMLLAGIYKTAKGSKEE